MTHAHDRLQSLRRPALLVRAARFALADYNRTATLRRLLALDATPGPDAALSELVEAEAAIEETRRTGAATYSVAHHIDLLTALMGEARLLPRDAV